MKRMKRALRMTWAILCIPYIFVTAFFRGFYKAMMEDLRK